MQRGSSRHTRLDSRLAETRGAGDAVIRLAAVSEPTGCFQARLSEADELAIEPDISSLVRPAVFASSDSVPEPNAAFNLL